MYDVVIIGAGVIGSSIARELSKYKLNTVVLEKEAELASGTTKANSGIVHAGFDAKVGSLKGKLNVKGNSMFTKLSEELDFPFKRNGSLVLCFDESEKHGLEALKAQGEKNGVQGLTVISGDEARKIEPNLSDNVVAALYAPTGGIVCPYEMCMAMAENAYENGVEFKFNKEVVDIKKTHSGYTIVLNDNEYIETKLIVNAAGLYSDLLNNIVSDEKINIVPRKGEYCLFDKSVGNLVSKTIFQLPTKAGKGVLVTSTVDGNLLVGPSAVDIDDKTNVETTKEGLDYVICKAKLSVKALPMNQIITSFTGLRAGTAKGDFIIAESESAKGFINASGIESPGLSAAPAIGEMVSGMVVDILKPDLNEDFNGTRKGIVKFRELSNEERDELIKNNADYGKIVCRCETVTEGEIIDAIRRPLGATTVDGVKRRTRAGMGRCQSGFCTPKVLDILSRELKLPPTEITKFGKKSKLLIGKNKEIN